MKWFSRIFLGLGLLVVAYAGYSITKNVLERDNEPALRTLRKATDTTPPPGPTNSQTSLDLPHSLEKRARTLGFRYGSVPEDFADRSYSRLNQSRARMADYTGNWIILNFWASWCTPCREEMPSLARLNKKMKDRDLRVLTVNVKEPPKDVRSFLSSENLNLPVILDREGILTETFQIEGLPVTWLLAPGSDPVMKYRGAEQWDRGSVYQFLRDLTEEDSR